MRRLSEAFFNNQQSVESESHGQILPRPLHMGETFTGESQWILGGSWLHAASTILQHTKNPQRQNQTIRFCLQALPIVGQRLQNLPMCWYYVSWSADQLEWHHYCACTDRLRHYMTEHCLQEPEDSWLLVKEGWWCRTQLVVETFGSEEEGFTLEMHLAIFGHWGLPMSWKLNLETVSSVCLEMIVHDMCLAAFTLICFSSALKK